MSTSRAFWRLTLWSLLLTSFVWATAAPAAPESDDAIILVANPQLQDGMYGASILIAKSLPDGETIGLIINKPLHITLAEAFPNDEASSKVRDPIYLGGPVGLNLFFALVERSVSPGEGSIEMAHDLFLVINGEVLDKIIAADPNHVRFFTGMVVWGPGELSEELRQGVWYTMKPDNDLAVGKNADGLWEDLVRRAEIAKNAI